jgi:hypothetical protein
LPLVKPFSGVASMMDPLPTVPISAVLWLDDERPDLG